MLVFYFGLLISFSSKATKHSWSVIVGSSIFLGTFHLVFYLFAAIVMENELYTLLLYLVQTVQDLFSSFLIANN